MNVRKKNLARNILTHWDSLRFSRTGQLSTLVHSARNRNIKKVGIFNIE